MGQLWQPLDDLKVEDIPQKKVPNWKLAGPGAILVGLSIGAGEIIIWPRIAAEFGAAMIWAAVLGVFIQMWVNLEIARWTVATGETVYTGYCRIWRGFAPLFILLTLFSWIAPGWGRASGLALKALLVGTEGWGSDTFWTVVTFAAVALVLFGPKLIYKSVERSIKVLVLLITVGLIMVAVAVGSAATWSDLGRGIVNFGGVEPNGKRRLNVESDLAQELDRAVVSDVLRASLIKDLDLKDGDLKEGVSVEVETPGRAWRIHIHDKVYPVERRDDAFMATTPALTVKALFIALVFAGAGGTSNLFYTFYLRDKHIGMGARLPSMQNPLRGTAEKIPATGFCFVDNEVNQARFRSWWRFVKQDQVLYFWLLNTFTMILFIFGALAVLHPQGIVPGKGTLIWDQAAVLGSAWGKPGRTIFLLVGVATLFSTQLALIDGVSRSVADIIYTNFNWAARRNVSWWYLIIAASWIVAGCVITYVMERNGVSELGFLFNAAYMGGFAMAIYVPLTLIINYRFLPKTARPGLICTTMTLIAALIYIGFAVSCIYFEIASRVGSS